jgi:hypothetical protein
MSEIRQFFDAYIASFEQGPAAIAHLYHAPCITARMGVPTLNATRKDVELFFAAVLQKYRAMGWAGGDMVSLDSQPLGINSTLATVRWAYKDTSGNTLWEWTFSYNLYRCEGGWKILLQTLHDS